MTDPQPMHPTHEKQWFGHPRGLSTLFFTEMWERFSFYGMRGLLLLFMTAAVADGGLGWSDEKAGPIYGLYTAMVYLTNLPGGWIADRYLGQRRAVLIGGILIAFGHLSLTIHDLRAFFLGLALIVLGTGLLKPNISTMVGGLYAQGDHKRDAGFSIFYMGINLGALAAPLVCGYLAQSASWKSFLASRGLTPQSSWHWGFGAATVGMVLGLLQYVLTGKHLGEVGKSTRASRSEAERKSDDKRLVIGLVVVGAIAGGCALAGVSLEQVIGAMGFVYVILPIAYFAMLLGSGSWTPVERKRILAIPFFFVAAALFWSAFEQAGSTLNLFADRLTINAIFGQEFPSSWWQSLNAVMIVALAPVFAWLWPKLGSKEPAAPTKFSLGLLFAGLGFLVLVPAALASGSAQARVSPAWLFNVYLLHTIGELCLSPVGLSTMTKLAPSRITGQMMGVWFLASSTGNFVGGQVAGLYSKMPLPQLFGTIFLVCAIGATLMLILSKPIQRLMEGVR